jgi:hypothetical protein
MTKYSLTPQINDTINFNFVTNDDDHFIDFYKNEKIILENNINSIKKNRLYGFSNKEISTIAEDDNSDENFMHDDSENFTSKKGILEKLESNDFNMRFLDDDDYEDEDESLFA